MVMVTFKNGTAVQGSLDMWQPDAGYFQVRTEEGLVVVWFDRIEAAEQDGDDLFERAAKERMSYVHPT